MHTTIADYVAAAEGHLPPTIVSQDVLAQIYHIARRLSPAHLIVFESRLDEIAAKVDFLISMKPTNILQPEAAGLVSKHAVWSAVDKLCQDWQSAADESWFKRGIDSIWLEFDTSQHSDNPLVPGIFFASLEAGIFVTPFTAAEQCQVVREALANLPSSTRHDAQIHNNVERIMAELPATARIFALGDMNGRTAKALRVSISHFPPQDLLSFLKRIGWQGSEEAINKILEIAGPIQVINVNLDVGAKVGPQVGLEFVPGSRVRKSKWIPLLDRLVAHGLCLPAKRDALLTWPGYTDATHNFALWPSSVVNTDGMIPPLHCILLRYLSHVKIVYRENEPLFAKAYFSMRQTAVGQAILGMN